VAPQSHHSLVMIIVGGTRVTIMLNPVIVGGNSEAGTCEIRVCPLAKPGPTMVAPCSKLELLTILGRALWLWPLLQVGSFWSINLISEHHSIQAITSISNPHYWHCSCSLLQALLRKHVRFHTPQAICQWSLQRLRPWLQLLCRKSKVEEPTVGLHEIRSKP
jgi:hypothetical protein